MAEVPPDGEQRALFALEDDPSAELSGAHLAERVAEVRSAAQRIHRPAGAGSAGRAAARDQAVRDLLDEAVALDAPHLSAVEVADELVIEEPPQAQEGPEALSIAEFYERVKRALSQEFTEEIWVTGEIRGMRESKGHRFLELADVGTPTGRGIAPQLEVACWARQWPRVARDLAAAGVELEVGRVVRVLGQVSVWDGAGKIRFTMTRLDVEALVGNIAAARRGLLLRLESEGLLEANREIALTPVPLRVGLVTSPGSEGQRDFSGQLDRSGFAFSVHLAPSLVQGPDAPAQLVAALRSLEAYELDLAVIVRGGGARGDLACFDTEEVARAIASASFPVWTGIGHTGDRSVADEVAQRSCITPTACGEAIVALVAQYWDGIERRARSIDTLARTRLDRADHRLERERAALARGARRHLDLAAERLRAGAARVERSVIHRLDEAATRTVRDGQVLRAYDPKRQLERGWSLTRDERGVLVRSIAAIVPGARLVTRLSDGAAESVVSETRSTP